MDALKFIKQAKRMCHSYDACKNCPAHTGGVDDCLIDTTLDIDADIAVDIVEKWMQEHQKKTRQSEFLKLLPQNMEPKMNGDVLEICPALFIRGGMRGFCTKTSCKECETEFWKEEVE